MTFASHLPTASGWRLGRFCGRRCGAVTAAKKILLPIR
jgi:hypothetical protein